MSPVAWSSFSTEHHPAKHNIFDFLTATRAPTCRLSSTRDRSGRQVCGSASDPAAQAPASGCCGSRSRSGNPRPSTTSPAHDLACRSRFRRSTSRAMLSAMCVPDLRGSQGTFTYYSQPRCEDGQVLEPAASRRGRLRRNGRTAHRVGSVRGRTCIRADDGDGHGQLPLRDRPRRRQAAGDDLQVGDDGQR